jgi:hypothetical protein
VIDDLIKQKKIEGKALTGKTKNLSSKTSAIFGSF